MFERPKNAAEVERDRERLDNAGAVVKEVDERIAALRGALSVSEEKIAALEASLEREREMFTKGEGEWGPMELKIKEREYSLLEEQELLENIKQSIKNMSEHRDEGELAIEESAEDFKRHLN